MASLADAIIQEDINSVRQLLHYGHDVNELDVYGFTPLIEAAIVDHVEISQLLLQQGADPNQQDVTGGTALHWAAENNNITLCQLLLKYHADPNAYNLAGQPVLLMPMLRQQLELKKILVNAGGDQAFAQDYINTKLMGHLFELVGTAEIIDPKNRFVDVDFEGFYLEVTLGLVADSLFQFQNHFAAGQLRRYSRLARFIVEVLQNASQLIRYQQYRIDTSKYRKEIHSLIARDPLIIPVGYEGHAITFIRYGNIWAKCDRREDSRLYDNVMFYHMTQPQQMTHKLVKSLLYQKQSSEFINQELDIILGLKPMTELKVAAQISGNCSWANVEVTIPTLFFLVLMQLNKDDQAMAHYKTLALNFFHHWREWNKDRILDFCIQAYQRHDSIRKATKAEILAAVLFQCCDSRKPADGHRIQTILNVLKKSPYEYLIQNYLRVYYYEQQTEEGKRFIELLRDYGYIH